MPRSASLIVLALISLVAFPGIAGAAKNGTYVGKDGGKVKVVLKINNNRVVSFKGNPAGTCYGLGYTLVAFKYPSVAQRPGASSKIKRNAVFTAVFKGSKYVSFKDDQRTLTGKVKGNRISGRMLVSGLCQVDQKFTATRR